MAQQTNHIGDINEMVNMANSPPLKTFNMKLYTKEMFLKAAEKCEVSMMDAKHIMKYIDEYVTPIELPNDEEIKEGLFHHSNEYAIGFKDGIEYIKQQYK